MVFAKLVKAATLGTAATLTLALGIAGSMAADKKPAEPAKAADASAQKPVDIWYKLCIDVPTP